MLEASLPSSRQRGWATPLALALMPLVAGATALVAPHVTLDGAALDLATFLIPTSVGCTALGIGSLTEPRRPVLMAILAVAAVALLTIAFAHAYSMTFALVVGACLVALGWGIGLPIGRRVQHPGHLLPACIIAASADIVSVFSPSGPTRAIVESDRALSVLALPFPVLGTSEVVPTLGAGDLVFVGLLLGVAAKHGLSRARVVLLSIGGALLAGLVSGLLETAVPALPAIGLTALLGIPEARVPPPRDRKLAIVASVAAVTLAATTLASRFLAFE